MGRVFTDLMVRPMVFGNHQWSQLHSEGSSAQCCGSFALRMRSPQSSVSSAAPLNREMKTAGLANAGGRLPRGALYAEVSGVRVWLAAASARRFMVRRTCEAPSVRSPAIVRREMGGDPNRGNQYGTDGEPEVRRLQRTQWARHRGRWSGLVEQCTLTSLPRTAQWSDQPPTAGEVLYRCWLAPLEA